MTRQPPQVRPIVDVEHDLAAILLGDLDSLALRSFGIVAREMRAGDHDRACRLDEILVHIFRRQRHVGAVGAVEDHRRDAFILDRKQHQRRQPFRVGDDAAGRHALALHLFLDVAAHLLVADTRDDAGFEAEPRRADGDVRRAAADRFGEGADILQPRPNLLTVEVDGCTPYRYNVESSGRGHGPVPPKIRHCGFIEAPARYRFCDANMKQKFH